MDQVDGEDIQRPQHITVHETPKFDLDVYIANYTGRTRFRRLYLIGACSPSLRVEALRLAVAEAKSGRDLKAYEDALQLLKRSSRGSEVDVQADTIWMEMTEKQNKAEATRLEHELKGYKNNLIKESIRMGNEDLGNHYYSIGDLNNAVKAYGRMRDYCTTPAHIASTLFRIIQVSIEQDNWLAVQSQVHKIRNLQMKTDDAARNQPKIQAAMGLYQMCTGDYREAAMSFLATDPSLTDTYSDVLSSNDVAVYGGLCALASMDRPELQTRVLENASFRNFLELEPHIRRAISFFCSSKYAQCLDILEAYRADYLLDIYLQPHVPSIYGRIRTKSIVQYFVPFSRVTLDAMAQTFGTTATPHQIKPASQSNGTTTQPESIEVELISLIEKGILNAKIDLEARVLVAKESNVRADVHAEAQDMVEAFIREARMRLLRMNAVNAGLEIKAPQKSGKQQLNIDPMDAYQFSQQDQLQMSKDDVGYGLGGEKGRGLRGGGPSPIMGKGRIA